MAKQQTLFDPDTIRLKRKRGWQMGATGRFLQNEIASRLLGRLDDINRDFQAKIDIGGQMGNATFQTIAPDRPPGCPHEKFTQAPYDQLGLETASADLIVSNLVLHSVNDLVGCMVQINHALKEDGLFLCSLFGGETLTELRHSLLSAEAEITGRATPRVAPFGDIRDLGSLLGRAGYALPVADLDRITVTYEHPLKLMLDLRAMGETNALLDRSRAFLRRDVITRACEIYSAGHGDAAGRVPATFDIIYLTGWHPHSDQQKPLKPGSGTVSLTKVLSDKQPK